MDKKHIFSTLEKNYFLNILTRFKEVVESKDTGANTVKTKNRAWDQITREYNANPHCIYQASPKQLRRLWANMKQRQRDILTKERQHRLATGGGPPTSDATIDPDIAVITPALIVGVDNSIDSDTAAECLADNSLSRAVEITSTPDIPAYIVDNPETIQTPCLSTPHSGSYPSKCHYVLSTYQTQITPTTGLIHPLTCTSQAPNNSILTQVHLGSSTSQIGTSHVTVPGNPTTSQTPPVISTPQTIPIPSAQDREFQTAVRRRQSSDAQKCLILDKEFKNRNKRLDELHTLERELLIERIREARAKADLAELLLQRTRDSQEQ